MSLTIKADYELIPDFDSVRDILYGLGVGYAAKKIYEKRKKIRKEYVRTSISILASVLLTIVIIDYTDSKYEEPQTVTVIVEDIAPISKDQLERIMELSEKNDGLSQRSFEDALK